MDYRIFVCVDVTERKKIMSFGYRDEDWIDPPEDLEPDYFVSKCADCCHCSLSPDKEAKYAWCEYEHDWVIPFEIVDYNYDCFEGYNEEMEC